MTARRPLACLLLLAVAVGCARRTEIIGRLPDGAVADGPVDVPPGVEGGGGGGGGGAGGADGGGVGEVGPMACPSLPPLPEVSTPVWMTCGGRQMCARDVLLDPGVLAAMLTAQTDTDVTQRPAIVYPLAGSVHPMNLPRITLQWSRATTVQSAFRIRFETPGDPDSAIDVYVPHVVPSNTPAPLQPEDAVYEIPETLWRYIAKRNAGGSLDITVAAYNPETNRMATSTTRSIRFSPAPIEGALYFMSLEFTRGIKRYLFGARDALMLVPTSTGANCVGCHASSRDGTTLAYSVTYEGSLTVAPTANLMMPTVAPLPAPNNQNGVAPAVSPNGDFVVSLNGADDSLRVYDARTGALRSMLTAGQTGGRVAFPEWSPDGRELVASWARLPQPAFPQSATEGRVVVLPVVDGVIGSHRFVTSEPDQIHSHPSWSPDGQWIAFVSVPKGPAIQYNPMTRLRLVNRAGGTIHTLGQAMQMMVGRTSTYPKFAPTRQQDCNLLFLSFHSHMNYGLVRRNDIVPNDGSAQVWLAAIDLRRLPASLDGPEVDPSSPPVWLPVQDVRDQNLLGTWSDRIPCAAGCEPGGRCDQGRCVAIPP